jgi:YVTN family beta-propeller protein
MSSLSTRNGVTGMNELMLRELLEHAAAEEPPSGPLARNSLLLGIRLRRRRRAKIAASSVAVLAVAGVSAPAVIGAVDSSGPKLSGPSGPSIAYVIGSGVSSRCQHQLPGIAVKGCPRNPAGSITAVDTATGKIIKTIKVPPQPAAYALAPDGKILYLADSQGITPVNLSAGSAGKSIDIGRHEAGFLQIAITPDGKTVYVANYDTNSVVPVDTATNRAGKPIRVGSAPDAIAITPDGKTAYVADGNAHSVTPIDIATNTAGQPIQTGEWPGPLAVTPDGKTVYVADNGADTVTPISTATGTAGAPIKVQSTPFVLAVTPDGRTVYAISAIAHAEVIPISTATNTAGTPIPLTGLTKYDTLQPVGGGTVKGRPLRVAALPADMGLSPDGSTLYVTNGTNGVLPIDTASGTPGRVIRIPSGADVIAFTPAGQIMYVSDSRGEVTPVDTATGVAGRPVSVGSGVEAVVVAP